MPLKSIIDLRFLPITGGLVLLALFGLLAWAWPEGRWVFLGLGGLCCVVLAIGLRDLTQTRHAILRNYPVTAHLRFLLEHIRPEMRQYFFEGETFLRFIDRCHAKGINVPIVPGILPVSNFQQVVKFSAMCGASVPAWMGQLFEGLEEDAETRRMVAAVVAAEQVRLLQANGVDEFHFYTLNRPDLTYAIAHILGARPAKV